MVEVYCPVFVVVEVLCAGLGLGGVIVGCTVYLHKNYKITAVQKKRTLIN